MKRLICVSLAALMVTPPALAASRTFEELAIVAGLGLAAEETKNSQERGSSLGGLLRPTEGGNDMTMSNRMSSLLVCARKYGSMRRKLSTG